MTISHFNMVELLQWILLIYLAAAVVETRSWVRIIGTWLPFLGWKTIRVAGNPRSAFVFEYLTFGVIFYVED